MVKVIVPDGIGTLEGLCVAVFPDMGVYLRRVDETHAI